MAKRLEKPWTKVGDLVKRCWKASLRLWAGSVEMMRTEDRTLARQIARMELHVVFPTPPFPPTNTHFRESWSRMFCTVASGISDAIPSFLFDRYRVSLAMPFHFGVWMEKSFNDSRFKFIGLFGSCLVWPNHKYRIVNFLNISASFSIGLTSVQSLARSISARARARAGVGEWRRRRWHHQKKERKCKCS